MGHLDFCAFEQPQFEAICEILGKPFNTTQAELQGFYKNLRDDFHRVEWPNEICAERRFFTSLDNRFSPKYDHAKVVACDLPSLLSRGGQKTVMIIAQDALSKVPYPEKVLIGTPYALHIKKCREDLHTRRYFQMVDVLLRQGYQVYLTDFYKIYVGGASLAKKDRQRFGEVLKQEIELLNSDALITWGQKATVAVEKLGTGRPHYHYPHPSGSARWMWAKLMGDQATDKNILNYWKQDLAQRLCF